MTRLLVGMTGSLGILAMPSYLLEMRQHFSELKIIMTHSATQFIPKETFRMFSDGIYTNEFPLSKENMMHMELARWGDLFVVLPASANILAQTAQGLADTLLSATVLAYEKKVIYFPNMNSSMWNSKAVQRNVNLIREYQHVVINPMEQRSYVYASGEIEMNHVMPSVETVLSFLMLEEDLILQQSP